MGEKKNDEKSSEPRRNAFLMLCYFVLSPSVSPFRQMHLLFFFLYYVCIAFHAQHTHTHTRTVYYSLTMFAIAEHQKSLLFSSRPHSLHLVDIHKVQLM